MMGSPGWTRVLPLYTLGLDQNGKDCKKVTDPSGKASHYFGKTTAIDGLSKRFIIGVSEYASGFGKVVFGKIN